MIVSTVFDLALRKEEKWQKLWAKKNNKWTWIGFDLAKKTFLLQGLFPVTLNYLNSKMIIYRPFSINFFMKIHIENYSHKKNVKKPTYKLHD